MEYHKQFIVEPGSQVKLDKIDTFFKDKHECKEWADAGIEHYRQHMF